MKRLAILASIALFAVACQKGQDQSQASDSTARNLTLAPAESTGQMRDVADQRTTPPPATRNPTTRTNPPPAPPRPPAPPPMARLGVGTKVDIAATDTISSRTAKVGDAFTARVVDDVRNAAGRVVIPAGSAVNGKVADVKPAPNPSTPGTLTLNVS